MTMPAVRLDTYSLPFNPTPAGRRGVRFLRGGGCPGFLDSEASDADAVGIYPVQRLWTVLNGGLLRGESEAPRFVLGCGGSLARGLPDAEPGGVERRQEQQGE